VAIGQSAGNSTQGSSAIAIGKTAGQSAQGLSAVAIGNAAGLSGQGANAIAIGQLAGFAGQGTNAVAIGYNAATNFQHAGSIVINASGVALQSTATNQFYVKTLRQSASPITQTGGLVYNEATGEIFSDTAKTFVIDHPVNESKYLVHACLEGPESGVFYRGSGTVLSDCAVITLPEYTKHWSNFTIHLTPVFDGTNRARGLCAGPVDGNTFTVYGPHGPFHYLVNATRKTLNTEPDKDLVGVSGDGPYKWISSDRT
jgi:hypothetical protein